MDCICYMRMTVVLMVPTARKSKACFSYAAKFVSNFGGPVHLRPALAAE